VQRVSSATDYAVETVHHWRLRHTPKSFLTKVDAQAGETVATHVLGSTHHMLFRRRSPAYPMGRVAGLSPPPTSPLPSLFLALLPSDWTSGAT
jgi:hypothetical protein